MKFFYWIFSLFFSVISCSQKDDLLKEDRYYDKAYEFLSTKDDDSSFYYFNKAKEAFLIQNDRSRAGNCLINMAIIQTNKGDYYGAQETGLYAVKYFNELDANDFYDISANYNNLGIATQNLRNYPESIDFYNKAMKFSKDSAKILNINNKATSYRYLKQYNKAIELYNHLLKNVELKKLPTIFTKISDNLAYTKFLQNSHYNAEPELINALKIREKQKDFWGQNASHAHLADYYKNKDTQKATFHAKKMLEVATKIKSPDDQLEALQKLIYLETAEDSKKYFTQYQKLNDSLQTARSKAKNQFALIRYETEKAQTESAKRQNQILKQYFVIGTLVALLGLGLFAYQKRKKRLQKEKELEVKETQLKISKKVHDEVSNGIYRVMAIIENKETFNEAELLDELEEVYEKSRDISYDELPEEQESSQKIYDLLNTYSSEKTKVIITGLNAVDWQNIKPVTIKEIRLVLRELMTNMKKHSKAKFVNIKFEGLQSKLHISYTDNGIGLQKENFQKKNGLRNVENRIFSLQGTVIFDEAFEKGTRIYLNIPI